MSEQNKRLTNSEGLRLYRLYRLYIVFCATLSSQFDCFTLSRLDEDRKFKKIDTKAVSGDFNGHQRNQAV
jgi:hypothetical protein